MTHWLTAGNFEAARRRVAACVHRTPPVSFRTLGRANGTKAWIKCENLQKTGSLKVRGAVNAIAALAALMCGRVPVSPGEAEVALVSGGNVDDRMIVRALREGAPRPVRRNGGDRG